MKKVIIGMESGEEVIIKGGLSLGQLDTLTGESPLIGDTPNEGWATYKGYLRDSLIKWCVGWALSTFHDAGNEEAIGEYLERCDDGFCDRDIDALSITLGQEYNTLRNNILPYWDGSWVEMPWKETVQYFAKFGKALGALVAVKNGGYPALASLKPAGFGEHSWRREYNPLSWDIIKKAGGNPGKAERAIWAARQAYNEKWPSHGGRVSWRVLARAIIITGVRSPGKAAIVARAIQLGWEFPGRYRDAREFLTRALIAIQRNEWHESEGSLEITSPPSGEETSRAICRPVHISLEITSPPNGEETA